MFNHLKKIFFFYRKIKELYYKIIWVFYKFLYHNSKFGTNIVLNGVPFLKFYGKVCFGNNLIFNSLTQYNTVGLFKNCSIYVAPNAILEIGNNTGFSGVSIHCEKRIIIGEYCNFGGNVSIWDTDFHSLDFENRRNLNVDDLKNKDIIVGDDVFIGANSIILKGVNIGDRAIVGAGSVVTHNIPSGEIWAGNPAKYIKKMNYD